MLRMHEKKKKNQNVCGLTTKCWKCETQFSKPGILVLLKILTMQINKCFTEFVNTDWKGRAWEVYDETGERKEREKQKRESCT